MISSNAEIITVIINTRHAEERFVGLRGAIFPDSMFKTAPSRLERKVCSTLRDLIGYGLSVQIMHYYWWH